MVRVAALSLAAAAATYPTKSGSHRISSWDGTGLTAYSEVPQSTDPSEQFPVVVFINSWDVPGIEYLVKTIQWAKLGYVCVEYEARGWYSSGGQVDAASDKDIKDVQAVIDWTLATFNISNKSAIATAGISYGGGIAALSSAADPRIRSVLALSGWTDLLQALYWQNSVAAAWGELLVAGAALPIIGREDPDLKAQWNNLKTHTHMDEVTEWANRRGVVNMLDQINKNKPAFYISHNHQDNLFHSSLDLVNWGKLKVPKKIDLHQGTHASAELLGLLPGHTADKSAAAHLWGNALKWLDRFLKGVDNGIDTEAPVQMQLGGQGFGSDYVHFDTWPPSAGNITSEELVLGARDGDFGTLGADGQAGAADVLKFGKKSGLGTGFLFIADFFRDLFPITAQLNRVNKDTAVVYLSEARTTAARICGIPRLSGLRVTPSEERATLVTYLYSVDLKTKKGRLVTHGTTSLWEAKAGEAVTLPTIDFHTCCYDIPAGHAIAMGMDLYDFLYEPASTTVTLLVDYDGKAKLELPVVPQHTVLV
mmetsp:Transcript_48403/g.105357  ORF Transcript_48403/g.105357 Transcript_48403/m.105357 type:complete len:536 (+) Transcript_48403:36-1643(+)